MTEINYSTNQLELIEQLKRYLENNPNYDLSALDGVQTIDSEFFNSEVGQAYFQLAFIQLWMLLYPDNGQAYFAEVGGEVDFDEIQTMLDDETKEFLNNLIMDNPEFMVSAASTDGNSSTSADEIMGSIESYLAGETSSTGDYSNDEARETAQALGYGTSSFWNWAIETDEDSTNLINNLLMELAELDAEVLKISEALESGKWTESEAAANYDQVSAYRQILISFIQQAQEGKNLFVEQFSQIFKSQNEAMLAMARNLSAGA